MEAVFRGIDDVLYGNGARGAASANGASGAKGAKGAKGALPEAQRRPLLSSGLKEECAIWKDKFLHLRYCTVHVPVVQQEHQKMIMEQFLCKNIL